MSEASERAARQARRLERHMATLPGGGSGFSVQTAHLPIGSAWRHHLTLRHTLATGHDLTEFRSATDFDALDRPRPEVAIGIRETARRVARRAAVHARRGTEANRSVLWPTSETFAHPLVALLWRDSDDGRARPWDVGDDQVRLSQDAVILRTAAVPSGAGWMSSEPRGTSLTIPATMSEVVMAASPGRRLAEVIDIPSIGDARLDAACAALVVEEMVDDWGDTIIRLRPADWVIYGDPDDATLAEDDDPPYKAEWNREDRR